jgi:hypothetical protein
MINKDKPSNSTPDTKLNVGSGFALSIGDAYRLLIGAASGKFSNIDRTTSFLANVPKVYSTITNQPKL